MPEDEFEIYLTLLAKTLRLDEKQRRAVAVELRDHLETRLDELTAAGFTREEAIKLSLAEFGDASGLATDLIRPHTLVRRRRIMQTTFGTLAACAAVTFAVMTLTPTNWEGEQTQSGAYAEDDQFQGDFDGPPDDGGDFGGFDADDPFLDGESPMPLEREIHVVDCTDILRQREGAGDLIGRTASLASAVEHTVANVSPEGHDAISVQPFEQFLIITATERAFVQAQDLISQIAAHVERADVRSRLQEQEGLLDEIARLQEALEELERRRENHYALWADLEAQGHGSEHPDVRQVVAEIEQVEAMIGDVRHAKQMVTTRLQR